MRAAIAVVVVLVLLPFAASAAQPVPAGPALLENVPSPQPSVVQPRIVAAYSALIAAATLGILYFYRRRGYILHWMGIWLSVASAMAIISRPYQDARVGALMVGFAILLVVWSAGFALLAAMAFRAGATRWSIPLRVAAATAVWFLAAPFLVPVTVVIGSGSALTLAMLGGAAVEYLRLSRQARYAGALLVGGGLAVVVLSNILGAVVLLGFVSGPTLLNRLAVVNVITSGLIVLGMHILVFEDITDELLRANRDLSAAKDEVQRLAVLDPLTGCHNRRFFDEIERLEIQRHARFETPLAVVFIDVKQFKQLNDTLGHDAGDQTLRTLGTMLRRHVRSADYAIRWGGDEFVLLLACGVHEAAAKADELKAAFERERLAAGLPPWLGLSIGVSGVARGAENLRDAIRDADALMYASRRAGC